MIESLFGPTLKKLFSFCDYTFDKFTICKIGLNLISALEELHNKGFLFLDIKPDNIAIIFKDIYDNNNTYARLGLIDFGSTISYIDNYGNYIKRKDISIYQRGSTYFASINSLENGCPSRKDDLESLAYLLLYFWKNETPWSKYEGPHDDEYKIFVLKEKKKLNMDKVLGSEFEELTNLFYVIKKLNLREKPNYKLLKNILQAFIDKNNKHINQDLIQFNWEKKFYDIINDKNLNEGDFNFNKIINDVFKGYPKEIAINFIKQYKLK